MDYEFADSDLERMITDFDFWNGWDLAVVKAFRRRIFQIAAVSNETQLYRIGGLRFEKLKGNRSHQRSMRLNDQFRLILEIADGEHGNRLVIVGIEDYH